MLLYEINRRKYSYRQLASRRYAGLVLWFLENDTDLSELITGPDKKEAERIRKAYERAKSLRQDYKNGIKTTYSVFTPYAYQIKKAIETIEPTHKQLELFTS